MWALILGSRDCGRARLKRQSETDDFSLRLARRCPKGRPEFPELGLVSGIRVGASPRFCSRLLRYVRKKVILFSVRSHDNLIQAADSYLGWLGRVSRYLATSCS